MKSYFANSVQTAMEEARRELGEEAILVTSRVAPAEAGQPRRYEVVFATGMPSKTGAQDNAKTTRERPSPPPSSIDTILNEIREIRQQLESLRQSTRSTFNEPRWAADPATRQLVAELIAADVDPDLAQQLLAAATKRMMLNPPAGPEGGGGRFFEVFKMAAARELGQKPAVRPADLRAAAAAEIRDLFRVDTGFGSDQTATTVAALIGPPGAGKTSTIAKLAVQYGLKLRRPALLVSADNLRVAASEQLRAYASVLGLRFELAQSSRALGQVLEEHCGHGLILIDTPGFTPGELDGGNDLLQFLAEREDIRKHLVLPAPLRCADANRVSAAYEPFRPSHLILSRMDETIAFGPALNEAMASGLPVSFFTTGQRVPEDLEAADADSLIQRLLPTPGFERSIAAAA